MNRIPIRPLARAPNMKLVQDMTGVKPERPVIPGQPTRKKLFMGSGLTVSPIGLKLFAGKFGSPTIPRIKRLRLF